MEEINKNNSDELQQWYIEIMIIAAELSTSNKYLSEIENSKFRFKIQKKNKFRNNNEIKFSPITDLKNELMYFKESEILFQNIDIKYDFLEIYPLVSSKKGKSIQYEPTIIHLKDLKKIERYEEFIKIKNPSKSFMKIKLFISKGQPQSLSNYTQKKSELQPIYEEIQEKTSNISESDSDRSQETNSNPDSKFSQLNNSFSNKQDESRSDYIYLKSEKMDLMDQTNNEIFCEGFFGVSIDKKNPRFIKESENISSCCGHTECSKFSAYQPNIDFRIPIYDTEGFELNREIASLCFPFGIKLCLVQNEENMKINKFLNIKGSNSRQSMHIMVLQYYMKISPIDFEKIYNTDPTQNFLNLELENKKLKKFENNRMEHEKIIVEIERKLKMRSDFFFKDYVYVPKCICLVSKYPYHFQMEECLESILKLSVSDKYSTEDVNKLILHLIKEVPIPPPNRKLQFFIPTKQDCIEIPHEISNFLPFLSVNAKSILDRFSKENIILIYNLLLTEKKLLFIGDNSSTISEIIQTFLSLLYPLKWSFHYYILISIEMLKYLQSNQPFVFGIESGFIDQVQSYLNDEDEVYLIHIEKNIVNTPKNKLSQNQNIYKLNLPQNIVDFLNTSLDEIISFSNTKNTKTKEIVKKLRFKFSHSNILIFGDFQKYLTKDQKMVFNSEKFKKNKSIHDQEFYETLCKSFSFLILIQLDIEKSFPYFYRLNTRIGQNNSKLIINEIYPVSNTKKNQRFCILEENLDTLFKVKNENIPFVISPYFINDSLLDSDLNRIEDLIMKKNKSNLHNTELIIENQKEFFFSALTLISHKKYLFPKKDNQKDHENIIFKNFEFQDINEENNEIIQVLNALLFKGKSADNDINNFVNSCLQQIVEMKLLSTRKILLINNLCSKREVRILISKFIQSWMEKSGNNIFLESTPFNLLSQIIFEFLIYPSDESDFQSTKIITKSLFVFYKYNTYKMQYYLSKEVNRKRGVFRIWKEVNFWKKWFETEAEENNNIFPDLDSFYYSLLITISKIMYDLKLKYEFIYDCIVNELACSKLTDKNLVEEFSKLIEKQFRETSIKKKSSK